MTRKHRYCARLGISGLPDKLAALRASGTYVLYADSPVARDTLIFETVRTSRARKVVLTLARSPDAIARELGLRETAMRPARKWPVSFSVFALPPADAVSTVPPGPRSPLAGVAGGLSSLSEFGSSAQSLWVLEGVDHWFSWDDPGTLERQLDYVAGWSRTRQCCIVLVLGARGKSDMIGCADGAARMGSMHDHKLPDPDRHIDGTASLLQRSGGMLWWPRFWNEVSGADSRWPIEDTGMGGLRALSPEAGASRVFVDPVEQEGWILACQAAVEGEHWPPPECVVFSDNDALEAACCPGTDTVALFAYTAHTEFESLCRAVCEVRNRCGRAITIVVRECGWTLRHGQELLLLQLGADVVAPGELSFSRLQILVSQARGQAFSRPIISDYRAVLSAALPGTQSGYLSPQRFREQLARVLGHDGFLRLPHVIVQLRLNAQASHLAALESCRLVREGDFCTADTECVYLFLFACPVADFDDTLRRVLPEPSLRFFCGITQIRDIGQQLSVMVANDLKRPVPDYTDVLRAPRAVPLSDTGKPAAVPALHRKQPPEACPLYQSAVEPDGSPDRSAEMPTATLCAMPRHLSVRSLS